jgi:hypothetical protein
MTPGPAVVVEMPASDAAAPYAQVLVDACTGGLRDGGVCALDAGTGDSSRAVAIVSWEGTHRSAAKIDVGVRRGAQADWRARRVTFAASDAEIERWRSVGLIIATLVGGEAAGPAATSEPAPTPPAPSPERPAAEKPVAPPEPRAATSWFLEGGAAAARGASDGLGAWGATARAGVLFRGTPLFLTASLRYEAQPLATAQVHLEWGWLAVGVGVAAPIAPDLVVEARLEPTLGGARASSPGATQAPSGALFGVREGVGMTWWAGRWLGPTLSLDVLETTGSTVVNLAGDAGNTAIAKAQWVGWSAGLGLRFRPL